MRWGAVFNSVLNATLLKNIVRIINVYEMSSFYINLRINNYISFIPALKH